MRKRPSPLLLCVVPSAVLVLLHCGADDSAFYIDGSGDAGTRPDGPPTIDPGDSGRDAEVEPPRGLEAVQVVTGDAHTCAVDADGRVFCWGDNTYGQLGLPLDVLAISVPREVELPPNVRVVQLAAGAAHTCALTDRKSLLCWGQNAKGQLARAPSAVGAPDAVVLPSALVTATFVSVAAGNSHTCAVYIQPEASDGGPPDATPAEEILRLACWGDNGTAQLARDDVASTELPADVRRGAGGTGGPSVVAQLAALGSDFSVASLRVGETYRVQAWGNPESAVTTDVDAGPRVPPTSVTRVEGGFVEDSVTLAAGAGHACAAVRMPLPIDGGDAGDEPDADIEDGGEADADAAVEPDAGNASRVEVVCWGKNESGQLARGVVSARELADSIPGDTSDVGRLALGGRTTCVIDRGALRCAGANDYGQLGIGSTDTAPHPTLGAVLGLDAAVLSASVGSRHACALVERQPGVTQVACWGDNRTGQLGDAVALGSGYADAAADERYVRTSPVFVVPAD